uniref:Galectin n=1 Tax=Meloidogyne enterolobii TaxID=390850 RepID=A0A6V7UB34_MELEN|nr:unnamed protein product [Meloidogyne enterolobii]
MKNCFKPFVDFRKLGFGRGFAPTKRIIIFGTPLAKPESFSINIGALGKLLVNADVLFHFSPRFDEKQVILNSWITGRGWEREERSGDFPFKVGEPFVLEFIATEDSIDVNVNNKFFVNFARYDLKYVSQMVIEGGIQVSSVILCKWKGM